MNMLAVDYRGELSRQAETAHALGSPFIAAVLEAGERQLFRAPKTFALIEDWRGDRAEAALAMRFNAALHALARRNAPPVLGALFRDQAGDFDAAIGSALTLHDAFIADWMIDTPQTNEVGRAGAITAALMMAQRRFGLPFELLELGSSCGLNLNLAHYQYDLGGVAIGNPTSPVRIAPDWHGAPPPKGPLEVVAAAGVDLNPLRFEARATRNRLFAYVWADQPLRAARLEHALALARRYPPTVERGNAARWLPKRLAQPQPDNVCRVVFHSMVLQYLSRDDRRDVVAALTAAGTRATRERPLAWISFEWDSARSRVELWLTCWPDGQSIRLADSHPYGNTLNWHCPAQDRKTLHAVTRRLR